MKASVPDLVDHAASLRLGLLTFLREGAGVEMVTHLLAEGHELTMPAGWRNLPLPDRAQRIVAAYGRQAAEARLYALDAPVAEAARTVAAEDVPLPVDSALPPAPHGMIVFEEPVSITAHSGIITAATWGPLPQEMGDGVHLVWWTETRRLDTADGTNRTVDGESLARTMPLVRHHDLPVHFSPLYDPRLIPGMPVPEAHAVHAPALRAIIAAWYAMSHGIVATKELRADPVTGRALAAHKARHRGVQYGTTANATATAEAIAETARAAEARLRADHPKVVGEFAALAPNQPLGIDPLFEARRDDELHAHMRWLPGLYRAAALPLQQLELEAEDTYPGVFGALEEERLSGHGTWPAWCWMPMYRVGAALMRIYGAQDSDTLIDHALVIAALGAWRSGGRHALALDNVLPGGHPVLPARELPEHWPVPAVDLVHLDTSGRYEGGLLTYLDAHDDLSVLRVVEHRGSGPRLETCGAWQLVLTGTSLDDAAAATAPISYHPPGPYGRPMTDAELAADLASLFVPYMPILSMLAAPSPDVCAIDEAAATLGRRRGQTWPPGRGVSPYMTMWLARPVQSR